MNEFEKIKNRSKKFIQKLDKKHKHKKTFRNCERFCKKDYIVKMTKALGPFPNKSSSNFAYNTCKKVFCNDKCDGFDSADRTFRKQLNNGFHKEYTPSQIDMLKKYGALSGCVEVSMYKD